MQTSELIKQLDAAFEMRGAGNYTAALGEFETLERQSFHPRDIAALRLFQATCLTDMGRPEDALKRLSSVDKSQLIFSKRVDCEYEHARIERALGRTDKALDIVEKALRAVSTAADKAEVKIVSEGLRTLRGILLAEAGRHEDAIPMLEAVPIDDLGWAEARIHLGDCKYKKKLYLQAIDCYLSITSTAKRVHSIYREAALRNIGFAYYDLKQYTKAVEYLTQVEHAYDENPDMKAELFQILASSYSYLEMPQEAAKYGSFSRGSKSIQ